MGRETNTEDVFEAITEKDSKSLFKPKPLVLVLSKSQNKGPNIMTAGWWMTAGYDPFRYLVAVSHKTYTYEIIEENKEFVMAAPSQSMINVITLCGKVSGRELNKIDHLDLKTQPGNEVNVPILEDAVGNVECTVLDSFEFKDCTYYFAGVEAAHVRKGMLDGRVLSPEADPLAYMGSDWVEEEETKTKYRYYVDFDAEDIRSYPGDEVIDTLPEPLQKKYEE